MSATRPLTIYSAQSSTPSRVPSCNAPRPRHSCRVNRQLRRKGYGLLVHDAYRPWYVTKVFWDATPDEKKLFVADPTKGSRHNRGAAVDLTLYDMKTRRPVEMVGTYDETTDRSYPDYPGGTSLQRWHRDLLRRAMESEGFTVFEAEWWHFDYKEWQQYPIGNLEFDKIKCCIKMADEVLKVNDRESLVSTYKAVWISRCCKSD